MAPSPGIISIGTPRVEGTAIAVTGAATDPAGAQRHAQLQPGTCTRTARRRRSPTAGTALSFTPDDNGSYRIALTVSDEDGGSATAESTIDVANVAPTPSIINIGAARVEGTAIAVTGAPPTRPGATTRSARLGSLQERATRPSPSARPPRGASLRTTTAAIVSR